MASAVEQLLTRLGDDDPFDYEVADLRALQLEAANERLETARAAMPLLDRRADDGSVKEIGTLDDIVPWSAARRPGPGACQWRSSPRPTVVIAAGVGPDGQSIRQRSHTGEVYPQRRYQHF
jgi:hypothetical protein